MSDISKVKIGESYYNLKDAAARLALDGFSLTTTGSVKNYIDAQVGAINNFDIVTASTLPTASANTMYKIYLIPNSGSGTNVKDEYITINNSGTYSWELIGTTETDLSGYLPTTATVAGVEFGEDKAISAEALTSGLGLGALAYKDSATQSLTDYATGITGVSYQPAGSVSVNLKQTATSVDSTGSFKPEGSVTGSVKATGSVTGSVTAAGSISAVASDSATPTLQVGGQVSAPTVTVNLSTGSFLSGVKSAGTVPSFTEGAFTAATLTRSTGSFATSGVVASVGTGTDAETLIFTAASTGSATYVTGFTGGSKAADTFNAGAMPTFNSANAATGVSSTTATAPTFTGNKYDLSFAGTSTAISATFSGTSTAISATFSGTTSTVSVSGNYDKASVQSATFSGTTATVTPTLTKGNKTITVS